MKTNPEILDYFAAGFTLKEIAQAFKLTRQEQIKYLSIYLNKKTLKSHEKSSL